MKTILTTTLLIVSLGAGCAGQLGPVGGLVAPAHRGADTSVYFNGKIYTAASKGAYAEAIAVRDGRVVRVGTSEALLNEFPGSRRIDLRHHTVVPGFNDAHYHPGAAIPALAEPSASVLRFRPTGPPGAPPNPSKAELHDVLAAEASNAPGRWILGQVGPVIIEDGAVDRSYLDAIASANPVFLSAYWGHTHILNSKALEALHVNEVVIDPHGGRFGRSTTGRLDGRAYEYATYLTGRALAQLATDEEIVASQSQLFGEALRFGVTSLQMMSWSPTERYLKLAASAPHAPRIRWINWPLSAQESVLPVKGAGGDAMISVGGIKWGLDGTPYERGAAVSFPYADSHTSARPNFTQDAVHAFFEAARQQRQQILLHAVGDLAIEQVLHEVELVPAQDLAFLRPRIEHGDWALPANDNVLKTLGIVVVQNPTHFADPQTFDQRFGKERRSMRLASLIHAGAHVAIGSDGPLNPYLNIMMATIHPYWPTEAISREEAVDAYTREAAYAELTEKEKGTLEPGKLADFAVLSQDIFTCPPQALLGTQSVLTVIGGNVVWGSETAL